MGAAGHGTEQLAGTDQKLLRREPCGAPERFRANCAPGIPFRRRSADAALRRSSGYAGRAAARLRWQEVAGDETVFYWKLLYVDGEVDAPGGVDFAWLTKEELAEKMDEKTGALAAEMLGPFP